MTPDGLRTRLSRRWRPLLERVGGVLRPPPPPPHDSPVLNDLRARIERLESMIEGLQDAFYRESQRHDAEMEDMRNRMQPAEIARALSEDARKRGL